VIVGDIRGGKDDDTACTMQFDEYLDLKEWPD